MKTRYSAIITLLLPLSIASAQSIANGDFELMSGCPPAFGPDENIGDVMESWFAVQGTADGFHDDCPAMAPSATPGVPAVEYGLGYGGLWGTGEVFGQLLDAPIEENKTYCIDLVGIAVDLNSNGAEEGDPCLQLCLYGSTVEPPPVTPISFPQPVEGMPGTALVACSAPLSLSAWSAHSFTFVPEETFSYLFFTSKQGPECTLLHPYLCIDNVTLTECISTGMENSSLGSLGVHPNPAAESIRLGANWTGTAQVTFHDMQGRLVQVQRLADASLPISVYDLPEGLYQVSVRDGSGALLGTERLVIQR